MWYSFYKSTDPPLPRRDADHTLESWPRSSLWIWSQDPGEILLHHPPFCLPDFWNQWTNSSFREHVHVSCQTAHAASDSPNITVCIIRQLPVELVFIIWLTTRDNDYFSFPGKTNIAAFSFQHQRWCSLAFYQLKDFFFFQKKNVSRTPPHLANFTVPHGICVQWTELLRLNVICNQASVNMEMYRLVCCNMGSHSV